MQPWQGKSVWIWELSRCEGGNLETIAHKSRAAGVDAIIIKAHDGSTRWSQFTADMVRSFHSAGLKVGAWGYCYGSHPDIEAQIALQSLQLGADFYVADVEVEFERLPSIRVTQFMLVLKGGANCKPVGFTSYGLPEYHQAFPWDTFAAHADFAMPQVYWGDFGMEPLDALKRSVEQYDRLRVPLVPIGQAYNDVSPESIAAFTDACGRDVSWWSWQHANQGQWDAIAQTPKGVNTLKYGDSGDQVKQLQAQLNQALHTKILEDGQYGPATEAAVKSFQQIYKLPVTGTADGNTVAAIQSIIEAQQRQTQAAAEKIEADKKQQALDLLAKATELIKSL